MQPSRGTFVWYELMTTDPKAAEAFYRSVVGWSGHDAGMPGMPYTLFTVGETPVCGMMALPDDAACPGGGQPGWIGYVAVDDVDAAAAAFEREGGKIHRPGDDIPGIGRFAIVADPQGVALCLFKGTSEPPPAATPGTPGHVGWHELFAVEWESAYAFYARQFGWTKGQAFDMGPMGTYQLFDIGGKAAGGMMTKPADMPAPFWRYYFNVDGIGPAEKRVRDRGGEILAGPMEVPNGDWIVQCRDPQGAMFALVGPRG